MTYFFCFLETIKGGFTNDWRLVEEILIHVAIQQRVKTKGLRGRMESTSRIDMKAHATTLPLFSP